MCVCVCLLDGRNGRSCTQLAPMHLSHCRVQECVYCLHSERKHKHDAAISIQETAIVASRSSEGGSADA